MRIGLDLQSKFDMARAGALTQSRAVFSRAEVEHSRCKRDSLETLTGVFCAKEAFIKAASALAGLPCYAFTDVEVVHAANGAPSLELHAGIDEHFRRRGIRSSISITHTCGFAAAIVVLWTGEPA